MRRAMVWLFLLFLLPGMRLVAADDTMRYEVLTTQDGLSHRIIFDMGQDEDGYLWLATWNGLCRYDALRFDTFNRLDDGSPVGRLHTVRFTLDGRLACVGDNDSTYLFDRHTHRFSIDTVGLPLKPRDPNPYKLHVEGNGLLITHPQWAEPRRLTVSENKSLERTLLASYADRQDNLWVAFNDALYKISFSSGLFTYHRRIADVAGSPFYADEIRAFCLLRNGSRWISTKNGRICVYDAGNRYRGCLSPQGEIVPRFVPFAGSVYRIKEEADGCVWITTKGDGIYCCVPQAGGGYRVVPCNKARGGLVNDKVYDVYRDARGCLWVATFGDGISLMRGRAGEMRVAGSLLPGKKVRFITSWGKYIVAAGTEGLYIFDEKVRPVWQYEGHDFSVVCPTPRATYVSTMGAGLFTLDSVAGGFTLTPVSPVNETCNVILALATDADGSLWLVCDNKLVRYDADGDIQQFDQSYFHYNMTFSEAHPCLVDSALRIGYAEGWLEVDKRSRNSFVPPLYWKTVRVGTTCYTRCDSVVDVPAGTDVVLEPVAIDFRFPTNIGYSYRQDGDSAWLAVPDDRYIRLARLSPGTHCIEVRSTDCNGIWADNAISLTLRVAAAGPDSRVWILPVSVLLVLLVVLSFVFARRRSGAAPAPLMPATPEVVPEREQFLGRAVACVEEHMSDPDFTVDELADTLRVSRTILYKRMKDYLGITPLAFIKGMRIKRACQLLALHQYTVAEVAYRSGFSDAKYFGKVFKKEVGCSPIEYAAAHRDDAGEHNA